MNSKTEDTQTQSARPEEVLFDFAIDRQDTKTLMELLPQGAATDRNVVEYELQLLRIVTVGWSLSFYLDDNPDKERLTEAYWQVIHAFALQISTTTGLMIGKDIDYFSLLKERLARYVAALQDQPAAQEPAAVIGPEFAKICGNDDDIFTIMTGARMFVSTVAAVEEFLRSGGMV